MKKRFYFKLGLMPIIVAAVLVIILSTCVIVNAIALTRLSETDSGVLQIVSLVVSVLIAAAVLLLALNTHYTLSDKKFSFTVGFVFSSKNYADILLLRESTEKKMLLMYFKREIKGEEYIEHMAINIKPELFKEFVDTVRGYNSAVRYELFDEYRSEDDGYSDSEQ